MRNSGIARFRLEPGAGLDVAEMIAAQIPTILKIFSAADKT